MRKQLFTPNKAVFLPILLFFPLAPLYFLYDKKKLKKIPPGIIFLIRDKLDEVVQLIKPYFLNLSADERQNFVNIEKDLIKYLEVSNNIALGFPELFPSFNNIDDFKDTFNQTMEIWLLIKKTDLILEKLNDIGKLAGYITMESAHSFYQTVKIAARRDYPGTRAIFDELKSVYYAGKPKLKRTRAMKDDKQLLLFETMEPYSN